MHRTSRSVFCSGAARAAAFVAAALIAFPVPAGVGADSRERTVEQFIEEVVELRGGVFLARHICPLSPLDIAVEPAATDVDELDASAVVLSGVPAFDWCYGCSATSAAMLFGYYDRQGYGNMYAGPANGGVCPLDNSTAWAAGESPLSATHDGLDGLDGYGHVDDYYVAVDGTTDPYYGNWTEHGYEDCTADFMGTSQYQNWTNVDGSTSFYYRTDHLPLYDYSGAEGGSPPRRDGIHGMKLFAESRGYTVLSNYNQYIYGYGGVSAGFTFAQYCDEIDAGRPVLIQVAGHTMLGVGYDGSDTVLLHDTWNHSVHSMTWGGSYAGLTHYGVGVIELEGLTTGPDASTDAAGDVEETAATLNGTVDSDGGEPCEYRFRYGTSSGAYATDTTWTGSVETGDGFSQGVSGLEQGRTYYYVAQIRNGSGDSTGAEEEFTTKPEAPSALSAAVDGWDSVGLSWTAGAGADATRIQRSTGSYPADRNAGVTVYEGSGFSVTDSGLDPATTYYYRAWSSAEGGEAWSDGYSQDDAATDPLPLPSVTTQAASLVEETTATLNGLLDDDGGLACEYRFEFDTDGAPYAGSTDWTGPVATGDPLSAALTGLAPGTEYFYRAQARNAAGGADGAELSFTTKPQAPSALTATAEGTSAVAMEWVTGEGSSSTLVVRKAGSYPADRLDGIAAYSGAGSAFDDTGLKPGTAYYYRAWSRHEGSDQWSDGFSEATAQTEPALVAVDDLGLVPDGTGSSAATIAGAVDLAAATVVLSFDPAVAGLTAVAPGNLGGVSHNGIVDANATGQLTMSWFDVAGHSGDFTFATLTFHAVGTPPAATALNLTVTAFTDSLGQPEACEDDDGTLTVLNLMEGDVNLDLHTNIVDAMVIAQYTVGLRELDSVQQLCGDTTDDGTVDVVDALHIAQYTVDPDGTGDVLFKPLWEEEFDSSLLPPA